MSNKSIVTKRKVGNLIHYNIEIPDNFKLYRMRGNNEYSFSAFLNDEIWGTVPEEFNDPYDTIYILNKKELYNYAKKIISEDEVLLKILCEINEVEYDENAIIKLSKLLVNNIVTQKQSRNFTVSACFTEKIDNELMWAHYANNAKGFALEYDYSNLEKFGREIEKQNNEIFIKNFNFLNLEKYNKNMPKTLVPILYENKKYDATEYFKKVIDNELNSVKICRIENKELTYIVYLQNLFEMTEEIRNKNDSFWQMNCLKKKEWKYEKEWRLLSFNMNPFLLSQSPHFMIGYLVPNAIYLGEKISNYDKKMLISIAQEKRISVYQMKSKILKNTIKLDYKKVF